MARARNIKPGFYLNEELAQCSIMARFIFPGLWMMADKKGRLENRPLRIKAAILPYDNANMTSLLNELEEAGMIMKYDVDGQQYIQIVNFEKHQTPHYKEAESTIPGPYDKHKNPGFNGQSSKPKPEAKTSKDEVDRGQNPSDSLIPDSLIPDNGFAEDAAVVNQPSHTSTSTDEPPQTEHPKTGIFPMFAEWLVSKTFASLCKSSGISDALLTDDNLREFRTYWLTQPQTERTQAEWEHALIKSIKNARLRAGKSPPNSKTSRDEGRTMAARSIGFGVDNADVKRIEKEVDGEKLE